MMRLPGVQSHRPQTHRPPVANPRVAHPALRGSGMALVNRLLVQGFILGTLAAITSGTTSNHDSQQGYQNRSHGELLFSTVNDLDSANTGFARSEERRVGKERT